jgi:predicted nucleic acid-binding protein
MLDTNVLSEVIKASPEPHVAGWLANADPTRLYTSVLTLGEIVKGITLLAQGKRRTQIQEWLDTVLPSWFEDRILPVNQGVAERWGILTAQAKLNGTPLDVVDGLLAATAAQHDLVVVTRNTRHFDVVGVPVFNPWDVA